MEILRWQVRNTLKNYQYILCDSAQNAVLIDPLDTTEINRLVAAQNLQIRAILITHEHNDHAAEALPLQQKYNVPVYTSAANIPLLRAAATPIADKATVAPSPALALQLHLTPGHTVGHAAFEINGFLFSGDCLFHGGCGHCRLPGANVAEHYRTFTERLPRLNPDLILMPGHYYAARNLDFALHVEPHNPQARTLRARLQSEADELRYQTTLRQEKDYNPFLRLTSPPLRERLTELTGQDLTASDNLTIFRTLRSLRDNW